jgi:hypothetical protein
MVYLQLNLMMIAFAYDEIGQVSTLLHREEI